MKLNYRDKVILGIVLAIAIFIAGYFSLIKGKRQDIKNNEKKLEDVQAQKEEIEKKIARIEPLQKTIDETFDKADAITEIFVPKEEIDKTTLLDQFMKEYAEKNKVKVVDLKVDDTATTALAYYFKPYTEVASALRQEADINGTLQQGVDEESHEATLLSDRAVETVMSTRYGLEVEGKLEDVFNYLDAIKKNDKTIIITSFGYEKIEEDEDAEKKPDSKDDKDKENDLETTSKDKKKKNDDGSERTIDDQVDVKASIVIQLYSIYNMERPVTDKITTAEPAPAE